MKPEDVRVLPHRFDAAALPDFLKSIGLPLAAASESLLAAGIPLATHGKRYTIDEVDVALSKTRLDNQAKITVKLAMGHNGLLLRNAA